MTPFKIACPECATALKISDPSHVGKNAKCPKCRNWLTIQAPANHDLSDDAAEDEPPPAPKPRPRAAVPTKPVSRPKPAPPKNPAKPPKDEFDDFENFDDFGDDEFEELPPEPKPKAKPAAKKKKSKRRQSDTAWGKIGGGIAAVGVVLVLFIKFGLPLLRIGNLIGLFDRVSGIGPELTWTPDRADAIWELRVAEVMKAPPVQTLLQQPLVAALLASTTGNLGVEPNNIELIRMGGFAPPIPGSDLKRFAGVIKLSQPGNVQGALEGAAQGENPTVKKSTHGSRTLYSVEGIEDIEFCIHDPTTIVFGSGTELRSVIDKDGKAESTTRFGFLDKQRQFSFVTAPANVDTATGYIGTASLTDFKKSAMTGIAYSADLGTDLEVAMIVRTTSSALARKNAEPTRKGMVAKLVTMPFMSPELRQSIEASTSTTSGAALIIKANFQTAPLIAAFAPAAPQFPFFGGTPAGGPTFPNSSFSPPHVPVGNTRPSPFTSKSKSPRTTSTPPAGEFANTPPPPAFDNGFSAPAPEGTSNSGFGTPASATASNSGLGTPASSKADAGFGSPAGTSTGSDTSGLGVPSGGDKSASGANPPAAYSPFKNKPAAPAAPSPFKTKK